MEKGNSTTRLVQQQISFGDDNKKGKATAKAKCGGLSTALFTVRL
jgi:hypothetical protein